MEDELKIGIKDTYFWIDAISIDQANIEEKSALVPTMGRVFGQAFNVLVWLGTLDDVAFEKEELFREATELYAHKAQKRSPVHPAFRPRNRTLPAAETWPAHHIFANLRIGFFSVVKSPWFQRVWVIQEFALAKRKPVALLGSYVFNLAAIQTDPTADLDGDFASIYSASSAWLLSSFLDSGKMLQFYSENLSPSVWLQHRKEATLAQTLELIILRTASRESSLPHDRIYGLLGLIDVTQLPSELVPDYSKPWEQVMIEYTKFIFSETRSLALLDNEGLGDVTQLMIPSWTADFQPFVFTPINYQPVTVQDRLEFSDDGRKLMVDGLLIGKVVASRQGRDGIQNDADGRARLRDFHQNLSRESSYHVEGFCETRWSQYMQIIFKLSGVRRKLHTIDEIIIALEEENEDCAFGLFALQFFVAGYVILDSGDVLFYRPKEKDLAYGEHVVAVFKGSVAYTILEEMQDGAYRCVGQAYLMQDMAFPPEPHNLAPETFENDKLKRFTLI